MSALNITTSVSIHQEFAPTYNKAALIELRHEALRASGRDLDGKYAPQEKPVTHKQAMRKLAASSKKSTKAMDRLAAIESW